MTIRRRNIIIRSILTILTGGIYGLVWLGSILNDLYFINNQALTATTDILITILTCGIYGFFLSYKMGSLLNSARIAKGLAPRKNAFIFLFFSIFHLSLLNFIIIQDDLNLNFADDD